MSKEKRIALVVGNAEYLYAAPLHNPLDDALKMGEALDRLDFNVKVVTNCTIGDFQRELRLFSERLAGADAALFYYSGHALQYDGDNHLIPVDARLEAAEDLERLAYRVTPQLEAMRRRARVSLVFLDACRDDPFKLEQMGQTAGTKRVIVRQVGLKEVPEIELKDALIAFAAEQGHTAADGEEGGLSPFTKALLQHLETPGLGVVEMMRLVRRSVREATKGKQTPWSNDSLTNDFFFKPGKIEAGSSPPSMPPQELNSESDRGVPDTGRTAEKRSFVPASSWSRVRSIAGFNLAATLESVARSAGPLLLGVLSLTTAFVLLLMSQIFHLAVIKFPVSGGEKEIGFIAAPNWSIVYAVLFPPYLCLFAVLTERCKIFLTSLLRQGVIVGPRGSAVTEPMLFAAWNRSLQKVSLVLWGLLLGIVIQTVSEWVGTCLMPYLGAQITAVDWSTAAAARGNELQKINSIIFSCIAYLYMAVALYVYLAVLVYAAGFCYFLNTLADPTGQFRLVLRDATIGSQFSDIGIIIYWCAVLGLAAGFMMRLQAIYLEGNYLIVTDLLFSDLLGWTGRLSTSANERFTDAFTVPSSWTGLLEVMFTLLILFAVAFLLYDAFERARQYYLDNVLNEEWRENMRIDHGRTEIAAIRRQSFLATVFPAYVHMGVVVAGVVLSGLFIGYGSIALVTLIYAVVAFVLVPAFKRPSPGHELDGPEDAASPPNKRKS